MAIRIFRESFTGKYDATSPEILLSPGDISDGSNIRKVGGRGGWKARKGCSLHNTIPISAHPIRSLHRFEHPRNGDYHFIAQINSLLIRALDNPPASGTDFGTSLGVAVGDTPGFSTVVKEKFVYADGSGRPVVWQGNEGMPLGFLSYNQSEDGYVDYSKKVTDKRLDTEGIILGALADKLYIITHEFCHGLYFNLSGLGNANLATLTVRAWRAGGWTAVTHLVDGTSAAGRTLFQSGLVTWLRSTADRVRFLSGYLGYVYEIGWSTGLSADVRISELTTREAPTFLTNKWDGVYDWVVGAKFFDSVTSRYEDILGRISNESTFQYAELGGSVVGDYLYFKTPVPATAFGLGVVPEFENLGISAQGKITFSGLPLAGESFHIDYIVFTWVETRTTVGQVTIGMDAAAAAENIVNAINEDLTTVTAKRGIENTVIVTAVTAGTAGNSIWFNEASTNMIMDGGNTLGETRAGADIGKINQVECWDGISWAIQTANLIDTTKDPATGTGSFAQSGVLSFNAAQFSPQKRTLEGDGFAGYWYRLRWDKELSPKNDDEGVRLFIATYAAYPEQLSTASGCIEFKNRLFCWGVPEAPNSLRYSATGFPDCFSGKDSGYTDSFGDMSKIIYCCRFYNELVIFKEDSVWILEGFSPDTFGILKIADTVGLASPKTVQVVEIGYFGMDERQPLTIILWQATDGVYVFDGRKTRKVSLPIDKYFNPEFSTCIPFSDINSLQSFVDRVNNEYHLLLSNTELVYNYALGEWYPPWQRAVPLKTGLSLKATNQRNYNYGGDSTGFVFCLEDGIVDKDNTNSGVPIHHAVVSRSLSLGAEGGISLRFTVRKVWANLRTETGRTVKITVYKNMAEEGFTHVIASPSTSQEKIDTPPVNMSVQDCSCFSLKFEQVGITPGMEIWGFLYELNARGFLEKSVGNETLFIK